MKANPTIKDIALAANVSAGAVSLALNNRPGVSDKTRRKIQRIARKMDYRPNLAAKRLIGQPSHTIGLILRNIADPFFPELALGVEEKATKMGYSLLLCNTNGTLEKEKQALEALRAKGVDGVILSTVTKDDPNIQSLIDADIPFVCVNRFVMEPSIESKTDYVVLDNYACGFEGMRHLLRMGFERIAILTGDLNTSTAALRRKGEQDALAAFHVSQDPKLVVECRWSRKRAFDAAQQLLGSRERRPEAFFVHDDHMALGVREAVLGMGLRIPEDISLLGIDDIEMASLTGVDLSTISQKKYDMGVMGTRILIDKIEGNTPPMVNKIMLQPRLMIRKTCGYHLRGYLH
jgi:LacI family transcriptional regulator